jgi:hypothetical protein
MTKKNTPAKAITLRQRLRADAEKELDKLIEDAIERVEVLLVGTSLVSGMDLMRLACSTKNKSLRQKMVTQIANGKERKLERMYNDQQKLDLEKKDASA